MAGRFIIWTGTPSDPDNIFGSTGRGSPTAGGPVDWLEEDIGGGTTVALNWRYGKPHQVDTGGAFSAGDDMATDGDGRAVQATSGDVIVGRALEGGSGAGDVAWIVAGAPRLA